MDTKSTAARSQHMRKIHSKDTKPEMVVRRLVHGLGYRYRLHRKDLPGKPDLVFPSKRKVIFVHGCLWHQHTGCNTWRVPKSRQDYWVPKLNKNVARDTEHQAALRELGWDVLVIWECKIKNTDQLANTIQDFLSDSHTATTKDDE